MLLKALKIVLGIILLIEFTIGIGLLFLIGFIWLSNQLVFVNIYYHFGRIYIFVVAGIITIIISTLVSYKLTNFWGAKIEKRSKLYSIIAVLPFILLVIFIYYLIQDRAQSQFFGNRNNYINANPTTSTIEDLKWNTVIYTIYYLSKDNLNLYEQKSNSPENTNIYSSQQDGYISDYFPIEPQNKLLVITGKKVLLMDTDGKNQKKLVDISDNHSLMRPRLSLDRNILVLALAKGSYSNLKEDSDDVYIINLVTGETQHFAAKDQLFNSTLIDDVIWLTNNTDILFRTTGYPSGKPTLTKYVVYNIDTKNSKFISEFDHPPVAGTETSKKISEFVDTNNLFLPEPNNYEDPESYDEWQVKSPDETKSVIIKNGIISVNNKDVFSWNYYNSLHNPGCRNPAWLPDTIHLIVLCSDEIRIIETDTKKAALFAKGVNPKWFDKYRNQFSRNDLK